MFISLPVTTQPNEWAYRSWRKVPRTHTFQNERYLSRVREWLLFIEESILVRIVYVICVHLDTVLYKWWKMKDCETVVLWNCEVVHWWIGLRQSVSKQTTPQTKIPHQKKQNKTLNLFSSFFFFFSFFFLAPPPFSPLTLSPFERKGKAPLSRARGNEMLKQRWAWWGGAWGSVTRKACRIGASSRNPPNQQINNWEGGVDEWSGTEIVLKEKYALGESFKQEWSASPAWARGMRGGGDADEVCSCALHWHCFICIG